VRDRSQPLQEKSLRCRTLLKLLTPFKNRFHAASHRCPCGTREEKELLHRLYFTDGKP
jgi:hypothetical protein